MSNNIQHSRWLSSLYRHDYLMTVDGNVLTIRTKFLVNPTVHGCELTELNF